MKVWLLVLYVLMPNGETTEFTSAWYGLEDCFAAGEQAGLVMPVESFECVKED